MSKNSNDKYWENEEGETVEFGSYFMRCYDKAGKLQFGNKFKDKRTGEDVYAVKFVVDRDAFFASPEDPAAYLQTLLDDWREIYEVDHEDD